MSKNDTPVEKPVFEPARPHVVAAGVLSVWVVILSLPMLGGQFLAGPWSDQYTTGLAFRDWGAAQWVATGAVPLWNPTLFGGMPFVAAMHGDIFYPTSFLRLIMPTVAAMNLAFFIHYIIAGFFTYLFLRKMSVSWTGAVTGGFAYQLSGVVGSYVQPGHDGKLFVTALLPVALLALVLGVRERKIQGHALLALTVGLGVLSPHYQMVYYLLIVAGVFALYLAFGEASDRPVISRVADLGFALGAVVVGFGVAMIQVLPFYHYIPFSPRAEGYRGFEGSASFGVPWSHFPELFLSRFVGDSPHGTYWGTNPLKLHSEYLGLPAVALAVLGAMDRGRRRFVLWFGGIGLLFLLVSLGGGTPFYRLWWEVMPFVKQTRAPGMALYTVAFVVSVLAALGAERLEKGDKRPSTALMATGGAVLVLAAIGAFGGLGELLSSAATLSNEVHSSIRLGAVLSGLSLLVLGGIVWARQQERLPVAAFGVLLPLVVGGDLFLNAREFWTFSDPGGGVFQTDAILETLESEEQPFRAVDLGLFFGRPVYPGSMLMGDGVSQLFGHHGNELHEFDVLLGGKNVWNSVRNPVGLNRIMDLYAVRYVMVPSEVGDVTSILFAFERVQDSVVTGSGAAADLYERSDTLRYARFVPGAVKMVDQQAVHTMMLPQFPINRVITVADEAGVDVQPLDSIPDAVDAPLTVESWAPGHLTISGDTPEGYVLVAENYYPDWNVTVNGDPAAAIRANVAMLAVPVPAGQKTIQLDFVSADYELGKMVTLASLLLVLAGFVVPVVMKRRTAGVG